MPQASNQYRILIAESFSCQRDLILNLKQSSIAPKLKIYASHSSPRAEILSIADVALMTPMHGKEAVAWILEQCQIHKIQLVFVGKHVSFYEEVRAEFEQHGILLITGALSLETHQYLDDKAKFTEICLHNNLAITPATSFTNAEELEFTYVQMSQDYPNTSLCAKPVKGVFGHGFVRFKADADFNGLFRIPLEMTIEHFTAQYAALEKPPQYILMPYLAGQECSVDIACHEGKILSLATRIKEAYRQKLFLNGDCDVICQQLVALFKLDGLINIQFRQDHNGKWHILEINARPAGGFSYSMHTGRNLIADLIAHKLELTSVQPTLHDQVYVYPYTASLSTP